MLEIELSFRQIVALAIKGFLSTWRNLFGLEWQAGSSPRERCSQRMSAYVMLGEWKSRPPARQTFNDIEAAGINKGHKDLQLEGC
jgi:hypothetical protein